MTVDQKPTMEMLISLSKRRGFVFPSSDIYGGFAAVYDYGPYGVELAQQIKNYWWYQMVQLREDIVGLDAAIVMHPRVWEASGHVAGFSDPLTECRQCHARVRVDHLLEEVGVAADEKMSVEELQQLFSKHQEELRCPLCQAARFTEVKKFNLLVQTNVGNFVGEFSKNPVYLRGETCQGIYVNYKNVLQSTRVRIPFGIAQIGKAFRNEITARQFIFRTREFEQMEMQYFVHPGKEMEAYEALRQYRWDTYMQLGVAAEHLRWKHHDNLVFYAKEAYDIEYEFPFGWKELEGVHARGDYDLTRHQEYSGVDLSYTDPVSNEHYIPHIVESSVGVGRMVFMVLAEAYTEEKVNDGVRVVLRIPKRLVPVQVAVFPLLRNRPELVQKAQVIYNQLKVHFRTEFDDNGNVGKRYRRQDEIGTPYCVTVDFDSLSDDTVTIRSRDTMRQDRIAVSQVGVYLRDHLN